MNVFKNLPVVSDPALAAFDEACAQAESDVVTLCVSEDAPASSMGPNAPTSIATGMRFVSGMLRSSMRYTAGEILADQMAWARSRLPASGVPNEMVRRNLERYKASLERQLPTAAFTEVAPYIDAMLSGTGAGSRG